MTNSIKVVRFMQPCWLYWTIIRAAPEKIHRRVFLSYFFSLHLFQSFSRKCSMDTVLHSDYLARYSFCHFIRFCKMFERLLFSYFSYLLLGIPIVLWPLFQRAFSIAVYYFTYRINGVFFRRRRRSCFVWFSIVFQAHTVLNKRIRFGKCAMN